MEVKDYIEKIVENNIVEDMHELSEIFEDVMEHLKNCDEKKYKKYELELYEMANGKNLTDEIKIKWVNEMQPSAKWKIEEVQEIYARYGIEMPFYSFFVIINMMYSDMGRTLGSGNDNETLTRYVEVSQDWYFDEDAVNTQEAKLYNYWKYIAN